MAQKAELAEDAVPSAHDVQRIVQDAWHSPSAREAGQIKNQMSGNEASVYVALRSQGRRLSRAWATEDGIRTAIWAAMEAARSGLPNGQTPDAVELCILGGAEDVSWSNRGKMFSQLRRGVVGIELHFSGEVTRVAPTEILAANTRFSKVFNNFTKRFGLNDADASKAIKLSRFNARQFLIPLSDQKTPVEMFRGSETVPLSDITRESVSDLAERMSGWMFNNLMPDGRMIYKYWPSQGKESPGNNTIRQWMATVCLGRIATFYQNDDLAARARANIAYNLKSFHTTRDGFASIEYGGSSKLGAIALAALALAENGSDAQDAHTEQGLRDTIQHLWQPDGSFRTFLWPQERNDNQNFYPGEALLYLAHHYKTAGEEELASTIRKSAEYYRTWHLENRNPAFVPWHTMAYCLYLDRQFDAFLAEWVFEMNDWLLSMQQTAPEGFPDIDGRFYDPKRPKFGVPHASSTGVYLEGLISALQLARRLNDDARAEAYRKAIVRGLRSLMQLEFRTDAEMFYISRRERVYGGLRTTVYNNEIRVDNVQHGLMAILRILDAFSEADFRLD